ncbi:MAG: nucleoside triphosphate pyrophosphohydrolase [Verrucomicrobiae bacterium]|nr:nucleoside triphosphate pyrophosphohydrolase [Verrucomicrobiae bacterium]
MSWLTQLRRAPEGDDQRMAWQGQGHRLCPCFVVINLMPQKRIPSSTRNIARLLRIMAKLRSPQGCPWDREQTHQSIAHNLIEEAHEALAALEAGNLAAFCDELGDLLLQVVFHAQMASERGEFNFDDVARAVADKLVHRHPHVFGKARAHTSAEVLHQWEQIKKAERNTDSILDELPRSLPALMKADKVQRKVARVGFDWQRVEDVLAKVEEELGELRAALRSGRRARMEDELGDLLFATVNVARFQGLQAESVLNRAVEKFIRRFRAVERAVHKSGRQLKDCSLAELDRLWNQTKRPDAPSRRQASRALKRDL